MAAVIAITGAVAVAMLCQAQIARADIYWADFDSNSIGRAYYSSPNNAGSIVPTDFFLSTPYVSHPNGVAVDAGHIYWTNTQLSTGGSIGRANLDGTNPSLMFIPGLQAPRGIAIDGNYIYWANSGGNSIGRANLDGSSPNAFFIRNVNAPDGVAVDSQYIYWTSLGNQSIGRANIDGTNPNFAFIPGAIEPYRLTVDGNYVYWANQGVNLASTSIERAALSGLVAPSPLITNINTARGVAVDANYVYWTDSVAIGRANLDGTGKSPSLIATTGGPVALAVNSGGPPTSLSPPRITGSVSVGGTLTESHGGWSANPTSFTYQWLRCDQAGANCVQIPFAALATYHLTPTDAGHTFGLQETAANAFGHNTSSASPTAIVPNYATLTPTPPVGTRVAATVACFGATGQTCAVSIYARVRVVKHGKATMVTVGKASYPVRTSSQTTIHLDLNGTGKGLLARAHSYRLPADLVMTGTTKFTAKVVFRYARIIPKADVQAEFVPAPAGHFTVVKMLFAAPVPTAAHVSLICRGSGCPTTHRRTVRARKGRADFAGLFRGANLGPSATVEISITLPSTIGEVALFAGFGQGVHRVYLCLPPGYQRAVKCL